MRYVHQTTCQIAGVRRFQRGIRQPLTSAVRRNEIFKHGQTVSEARFNGNFDFLTLRVHHQTAHTGKLFDLVDRTAGAGIRHHPDGVELIRFALLLKQLGYFRSRLVPLVDHGVVTFLFGKQTSGELLGNLAHRFFRLRNDFLLLFGNLHIEYRSGKRCKRGILVTSFLNRVQHVRSLGGCAGFKAGFNDFGKMLLADGALVSDKFGVKFEAQIRLRRIAVHEIKVLRQPVVINQSADRGADNTHHFAAPRLFVQAHRRALDGSFSFRNVFIEIAFAGIRQR